MSELLCMNLEMICIIETHAGTKSRLYYMIWKYIFTVVFKNDVFSAAEKTDRSRSTKEKPVDFSFLQNFKEKKPICISDYRLLQFRWSKYNTVKIGQVTSKCNFVTTELRDSMFVTNSNIVTSSKNS